MEINGMKVGELMSILKMVSPQAENPFVVGNKYFIRTATNYFTGRVSSITGNFIFLTEAAWIADTGRYHEFLKTGKAIEAEPYPNGTNLNIESVIDFCDWGFALITEQI